jgi:hypothetical protein
MRMDEPCNDLCFLAKLPHLFRGRQQCMQQFDGRLCAQMNMDPQIDFGKPALAQKASEAILAQRLPDMIIHRYAPQKKVASKG